MSVELFLRLDLYHVTTVEFFVMYCKEALRAGL